jgi:hypothetical protein
MNKRKKILVHVSALLTLTLGITLLTVPTSAVANLVGEEECRPAVLMLKGSGEGINNEGEEVVEKIYENKNSENHGEYIKTNGHEGAVISKLLQAFVNETDPEETVSKARFVGIKYPALPVSPDLLEIPDSSDASYASVLLQNSISWTEHLIKYNESYRLGAEMTIDFINQDRARGCITNYMLLSYSQGVISTRLALNLAEEGNVGVGSTILSSFVIGDPFQKANAAVAPRQITTANTSSSTDGSGRLALDTLTNTGSLLLMSQPALGPALFGLNSYKNEMTQSDSFIYRDNGGDGLVSRTLCHQSDSVCGVTLDGSAPIQDILQHVNYFDSSKEAGAKDLAYEVEAFDKQVKRLVLSSEVPSSKPRVLKRTTVVEGKTTSYNIAYTKLGDMCSWDHGSDGTEEVSNVPCGIHNVITTSSEKSKMTVRIVDSFGIEHILSDSATTVPPSTVDKITSLDKNTWYQIHPYGHSNACIGSDADALSPITAEDYVILQSNIEECESVSYSNLLEKAKLSQQLFKKTPSTEEGKTHHESMAWGYNDEYKWIGFGDTGLGYKKNPNSYYSDFAPKLIKTVDGVPYYAIEEDSSFNCLRYNNLPEDGQNNLELHTCPIVNAPVTDDFLFSVTPVSSNPNDFGDLSLERDTVAPEGVKNLTARVGLNQLVSLNWEPAIDDRDKHFIKYDIYKETSSGDVLLDTVDGSHTIAEHRSYEISLVNSVPNTMETYKVIARDTGGNVSDSVSVSFMTPPPSAPLPSPVLNNIGSNYKNITISFPYDPILPVELIKIYRNGEPYTYLNGHTPKDNNIANGNILNDEQVGRGNNYVYTYELISPNGYVSERSEPLTVSLTNYVAPTAPSNVYLDYQQGNEVYLRWSPAVDDLDSNLTYNLYRNGVLLTQDYNANANGGTDYSAQPGATYVYTVTATDVDGNVSSVSNSLSVTVDNTSNTTAPTKPILNLINQTDTSISFEIQSNDNDSIPVFDIYVNYVLVEENYAGNTYTVNLSPGITSQIMVIAKDNAGNLSETSDVLYATGYGTSPEPSNPGEVLPSSIVDLQVDYNSHSVTKISWALEGTNNVALYGIYRDGVYIDTVYSGYAARDSYVDYSVSPDTSYTYTIQVYDWSNNNYEMSDSLTLTTLADPNGVDTLAPSSNLRLEAAYFNEGSGLYLQWSSAVDNFGSVQYQIYRDNILISTVSDVTYFIDADVTAGSTHDYKIIAVDPSGNAANPLEIPDILI